MSIRPEKEFVFNTPAYQQGANSVYEYKRTFDATVGQLVDGACYQFKTDAERMQNLMGQYGRNYRSFLFCRFYQIHDDSPSSDGPGSFGWGPPSGVPGPYNIDFSILTRKIMGRDVYVGMIAKGFLYLPTASSVQFRLRYDDGIQLYVNGTAIHDNWDLNSPTVHTTSPLSLRAGYTPIEIRYYQWEDNLFCKLEYSINGGPFFEDARGVLYHRPSNL
jgi:hypothetical protein